MIVNYRRGAGRCPSFGGAGKTPENHAVARANGCFFVNDDEGASVLTVVELADVMLRVELGAEFGDEVELGLEEVDVLLLVMH